MSMKMGEKIQALRKERHISQETLAEYLGVSFQAVSKVSPPICCCVCSCA